MRRLRTPPSAVVTLVLALFPGTAGLAVSDWPAATPESTGIDAEKLASVVRSSKEDPHRDLKAIVVLRHGKLVAEEYFNGDDRNTLHDIRSATKSITATLVGIAIDRHLIGSVEDSIAKYLPGLPRDRKEAIRIRDLLTMRSGLAADDDDPSSPGNESVLDQSQDWMKSVFAVPMKNPPGKAYVYVSINAFLAGVIVENASRLPLDRFADENLFRPLGISHFTWRHVPPARVTGQGNLQITARDAARIGELFLRHGSHGGSQVVGAKWVEESVSSQVPIGAVDPFADFYGYMWYTKNEPVDGRMVPVHFASGNGGNKIYVVPSLDMVVAITSSAYNKGYGQRRSQDILLRILAATADRKIPAGRAAN